jgi:hypothetical protein
MGERLNKEDLPGLLSNPNGGSNTAPPAPSVADILATIDKIKRDYRENKPHTHAPDIYPIPMTTYMTGLYLKDQILP